MVTIMTRTAHVLEVLRHLQYTLDLSVHTTEKVRILSRQKTIY